MWEWWGALWTLEEILLPKHQRPACSKGTYVTLFPVFHHSYCHLQYEVLFVLQAMIVNDNWERIALFVLQVTIAEDLHSLLSLMHGTRLCHQLLSLAVQITLFVLQVCKWDSCSGGLGTRLKATYVPFLVSGDRALYLVWGIIERECKTRTNGYGN